MTEWLALVLLIPVWHLELVLQNNTGKLFCSTLIVVPLTMQVNKKKDQPTHYLLSGVRGLPEDSAALLEQIKTVDKPKIISYLGKVSNYSRCDN